MDDELLKKNTVLQDFIMTKPLAADVIIKLEEDPHCILGPATGYQIFPIAVDDELVCAKHARVCVNATLIILSLHWKLNFRLFYSASFFKFTLAQHVVGRHLHVFSNGRPLLERQSQ